MNSFKNKWIEIQGYKHDGRMHRIWDSVFIVDQTDDYIVAASTKTKVIEHDFRIWYTKEPAIMIFFTKHWWNVIAMLKKNGLTYYVNLASPFVIDSKKVKYIDYDLDLKLYPNNDIRLIDVKEYMEQAKFPFNDEKIKEYYKLFLEATKRGDESDD